MTDIFSAEGVAHFIDRINRLAPTTRPLWGKMSVDQMLAHCNVTYELVYTDKHPRPKNPFIRWVLKTYVKKMVVNEEPYKRNLKTAPHFLMTQKKDFEAEKNRLIEYLKKTLELGGAYFEGKESHSFGALTKTEWNNMFSKHLDHHLSQFGV